MPARSIKKSLAVLLAETAPVDLPAAMNGFSSPELVGPLISYFYNPDDLVRWHAITALGHVVAGMTESKLEAGRVVMRRLMWHLNDESGGIGWGAPEAMGEIMARHARLADEFHHILISYIRPDGNYIEYEMLQRGVLWGIGRLAGERPALLQQAAALLPPYFTSDDPYCRALAAHAARILGPEQLRTDLNALAHDTDPVNLYIDETFVRLTVAAVAGY